MTIARSLKAALAASVCLPLQALAQSNDGFDLSDKPADTALAPQPTNWITLGSQYNSDRSYYLNRFTGAVNPGFYGLGDFHIAERDAWDSEPDSKSRCHPIIPGDPTNEQESQREHEPGLG